MWSAKWRQFCLGLNVLRKHLTCCFYGRHLFMLHGQCHGYTEVLAMQGARVLTVMILT